MKKSDFLSILEANLSEYPEEWVASIIEDYNNKFNSGQEAGITEAQLINSFGDPYLIAQRCKQEPHIPKKEEKKTIPEGYHNFKNDIDTLELPSFNSVTSSISKFFS